ncbi:inner membrane protein [Salinibacillus kushneri]|uniref:Inner membrane protein n=1 Tax=Salinibacillus kushneri TaxID=237682 RepID=A0A1H9YBZ4_9BACI|nr:metal-dependent hydrolase [Salinibacillus kushneri]SES66446.1 inner membrane protein [Salinibacillus kushneri]
MLASGHQAMGITWGVASITAISSTLPFSLQSEKEYIGYFFAIMIGSLLPDMDSMKSKMGRYMYSIASILVIGLIGFFLVDSERFWSWINAEAIFLLALIIPVFFVFSSHRTWTHSLLFVAMLGIYFQLLSIWFTIPLYLQMGCGIGVLSHIFGDFITKRGVPLFYPLHRKYYRFLFTFHTGSQAERGIVFSLVLANIWLLFTQV